MRIKHFEVKGLHGFIDTEMEFLPDMTIVVGRNGAGKTSVLDMIASLIRLDFKYLSELKFSSALLELNRDNSSISISVENTGGSKTIGISIDGKTAVERAITPDNGYFDFILKNNLKNMALSSKKTNKKDIYDFLQTNEWSNIAEIVKQKAKLTFVRLDRTIIAYDSEGAASYDRGVFPKFEKTPDGEAKSPRDPIEDVSKVMRRKHMQFRRQADRIQRDASSNLIKLHFLPPNAMLPSRASSEKTLRQKISELRKRVTESHLIANAPEIEDAISIFFKQFDILMEEAFSKKNGAAAKPGRRTLQEETLEVMIRVKEQQISELLKIFDREQEDTANAYASIKKYIDVASIFLRDSGKQLGFSTDTMELAFALAGSIEKESNESEFDSASARPIKELSSGERQILIVLTYLAFLAGENSIFVIDEPELSLHVRWQSQLIDALRELRPNGCQIILATHAPEIAGRARENCKILRPSYLNSDGRSADVIGELNG